MFSFSQPNRKPLDELTVAEALTHLSRVTYGDFSLTDAIRPSSLLEVVPREGFRFDVYIDPDSGERTPVIMAAASAEKLFELFRSLVEELALVLDVVLESSHQPGVSANNQVFYREEIDRSVLFSKMLDFEDLLLNDGCSGIAVVECGQNFEVQLDEHKLLIVYFQQESFCKRVVDVFKKFGIPYDQDIQFLTEAEHIHSSSDDFFERFKVFVGALSMCEVVEHKPNEDDCEQELDVESYGDRIDLFQDTPWSESNPPDEDEDDLMAC